MPHDHCDHIFPFRETNLTTPIEGTHDNKATDRRANGQRLRTWELESGYQCSIIGTCVTLSELRALARKLSLVFPDTLPTDYQIHGYFVKMAETSERPSRLLNKLLDRRHDRAIRQIRNMKSPEELETHWVNALESGNIPGPYWAICSHPTTTKPLADRMFADVHMLSHMVGASNRADIAKLIDLENNLEKLENRNSRETTRYKERLAEKNKKLEAAKEELAKVKHDASLSTTKLTPAANYCPSATLARLENELDTLREENSLQAKQLSKMQRNHENDRLYISALRQENEALESALGDDHGEAEKPYRFDLCGKRVLYVGGRPQALRSLRSLIENWNGDFIHHDGGIEKSLDQLGSAVGKADAVVFPTDCISHSAVKKIKQICDRMMKPYIPLRTSGTGSLVAGLTQSLHSSALFNTTKVGGSTQVLNVSNASEETAL